MESHLLFFNNLCAFRGVVQTYACETRFNTFYAFFLQSGGSIAESGLQSTPLIAKTLLKSFQNDSTKFVSNHLPKCKLIPHCTHKLQLDAFVNATCVWKCMLVHFCIARISLSTNWTSRGTINTLPDPQTPTPRPRPPRPLPPQTTPRPGGLPQWASWIAVIYQVEFCRLGRFGSWPGNSIIVMCS